MVRFYLEKVISQFTPVYGLYPFDSSCTIPNYIFMVYFVQGWIIQVIYFFYRISRS
jgi:hypothetical protein